MPQLDPMLAIATLTGGDASVAIDDFGRAGQTSPGCGGIGAGFQVGEPGTSVLCEHTDFFSAGGAVTKISPAGCTVTSALLADAPGHATSAVTCGACTFSFDQTVDDGGVWTTVVTIDGCDVGCYYAYTDFDVHGFANNRGSYHADEGRFVVQNQTAVPEVHYYFGDGSGAAPDHWAQGEFPTVRTFLEGATSCQDLPDAPPIYVGDWTSAIQYNGATTVTYAHGRDDASEIP